jgi:tetratricopeptide (TPR) repeat protein
VALDACCSLRRSDEAILDFTAALELEPTNALFFHNRGFCYRNVYVAAGSGCGDRTRAVIACNDRRAGALCRRCSGRFDLAVVDCTRAIELDSNDPNFYSNRCVSPSLLRSAVVCCSVADGVRHRWGCRAARRCSGYAFRKLGQWGNAIADYLQSLRLAPNNIKTYNNLGYSYAKSGDYENAIRSYSTVGVVVPALSTAVRRTHAGAVGACR